MRNCYWPDAIERRASRTSSRCCCRCLRASSISQKAQTKHAPRQAEIATSRNAWSLVVWIMECPMQMKLQNGGNVLKIGSSGNADARHRAGRADRHPRRWLLRQSCECNQDRACEGDQRAGKPSLLRPIVAGPLKPARARCYAHRWSPNIVTVSLPSTRAEYRAT
jgi:hypothetical protein